MDWRLELRTITCQIPGLHPHSLNTPAPFSVNNEILPSPAILECRNAVPVVISRSTLRSSQVLPRTLVLLNRFDIGSHRQPLIPLAGPHFSSEDSKDYINPSHLHAKNSCPHEKHIAFRSKSTKSKNIMFFHIS